MFQSKEKQGPFNIDETKAVRQRKIVIIGVGNVLCRDEGVGVHVAKELKNYNLPDHVEVYDCGTGGLDILEFSEGADATIIVDAVKGGAEPGEIYHFRLNEIVAEEKMMKMLSLHELDLINAIKIGKKAYNIPQNIIVIGIEPKSIELGLELTDEVREAVPKVIQDIFKVVSTYLNEPGSWGFHQTS